MGYSNEHRINIGKKGPVRFAALALCFVLALSVFAEGGFVFAATESTDEQKLQQQGEVEAPVQKQMAKSYATKITKVKSVWTRTSYTGTIRDEIKVSPAYGRKVRVYWYNKNTKKYVLIRTYKTQNKKTATITVAYNYRWKQHYASTYKIVAPEVPSREVKDSKTGAITLSDTYKRKERKVTVYNKFISAKAAIVLDASTGKIIYERNMNLERKPASMTKMMTALLLCENKALTDTTEFTKEADNTPYGIGIKAGDVVTANDLLHGMMLQSGNDTATQAGIMAAGSTKRFTGMANARAKALGMNKTVFHNAHGLDVGKTHSTGNYSTAYDMALLGSYVMRAKKAAPIRSAIKKRTYTIKTRGLGKTYKIYTTNEILGELGNVGIKTGTEDLAGACFCGAFKYKGRTYITVVMGVNSYSGRWSDSRRLAKYMRYAVKYKHKEFNHFN